MRSGHDSTIPVGMHYTPGIRRQEINYSALTFYFAVDGGAVNAPSYGKWILFPGLRCVAMPGTVPRRAGLVSNLQPVALYSRTIACTAPWMNSTHVTVIDISQIESPVFPISFADARLLAALPWASFSFVWIGID
ncbi:hypothetical protein PCH_Pc12g15260 [Penicillium rubens Wisconsin 54-1255]|uniref:Uncharacterized protein n=1 Tax=Penicillium rubens (strain ATCC 28089 / DSM 1075 / NRRL 1951 / Wisconsin 54-1255) TaxID=500485 RepID=B6GXH2_PENRW|nr:hypothetical protein PCH_Pc12g15260 [Penicillium rubens Wisconsin 54-1255]